MYPNRPFLVEKETPVLLFFSGAAQAPNLSWRFWEAAWQRGVADS